MTQFLWTGGVLVEDTPQEDPRIVDSYLILDGHVVRWDLHEQRFASSTTSAAWPFLAQVRKLLPTSGSWFPRIEWYGEDRFGLNIRPAPPLRYTTSLWLSDHCDPRKHPSLKGPDLSVLAKLRRQANEQGCDDALLISNDGMILEAANAAVVFWADETTVVLPKQAVLPSVTVGATIPLWEKAGINIVREDIRHIDFPAWCGSALHGWTPVVSWGRGSGKMTAAQPPAVCTWNDQLWGRD